MSLIDEALRRAQKQLDHRQEPGAAQPREQHRPPMRRARAVPVLAAGGVGGALAAAAVAFLLARGRARPAAVPSRPAAPATAAAPARLPPITQTVAVAPPVRRASAPARPKRAPGAAASPRAASGASAPPAPPGTAPAPPPGTPAESAPAAAHLRLGGIVFSSVHPVAIVDGQVVSEGEVVEGWTVVKIRADRVELARDGRTLTLPEP